MKSLFLALALLTAGCVQTVTPNVPSPVGEDQRSTEPGLSPSGYIQFCDDNPQSALCQ